MPSKCRNGRGAEPPPAFWTPDPLRRPGAGGQPPLPDAVPGPCPVYICLSSVQACPFQYRGWPDPAGSGYHPGGGIHREGVQREAAAPAGTWSAMDRRRRKAGRHRGAAP
jgi:hypothetical protein